MRMIDDGDTNDKSKRVRASKARLVESTSGSTFNNESYRPLTDMEVTPAVLLIRDALWPECAARLTGYPKDKEQFLAVLLQNLLVAHVAHCLLAYPRVKGSGIGQKAAHRQVINALVALGYVEETPSKKGGRHHSRLRPMPKLTCLLEHPRDVRAKDRPLVIIRKRHSDETLSFNPRHPVAVRSCDVLERVNRVNDQYTMEYHPWNDYRRSYSRKWERYYPYYVRIFTDSFDLHGRIYATGQGTGLQREERQTIRFDGMESIELDYSASHPRMLYHLRGIDYQQDPYRFLGGGEEERIICKQLLLSAINAKARKEAIAGCCAKLIVKGKTGDERKDALAMYQAWSIVKSRHPGLDWKEAYDDMLNYHQPIRDDFGSDKGMKLMRLEADIILNVMEQFALDNLPIITWHDSLIVPKSEQIKLRAAMMTQYQLLLGFIPTVKSE